MLHDSCPICALWDLVSESQGFIILGFQGLLNVCWIAFVAAALPETVYFSRGSVAMARLLAVIQRRPAASSIQNAAGERPASVQGELRLQGVTFAYPTRPALPVLKWRAQPQQAVPPCAHSPVLLHSRSCPHSMPHNVV